MLRECVGWIGGPSSAVQVVSAGQVVLPDAPGMQLHAVILVATVTAVWVFVHRCESVLHGQVHGILGATWQMRHCGTFLDRRVEQAEVRE